MVDVPRHVCFTGGAAAELRLDHFHTCDTPPTSLGAGDLRVAVRHVSLDPYVRLRLRDLGPGTAVPAQAVGEVTESADASFPIGTIVTGEMSWSTEHVGPAHRLTAVDIDPAIPLHHYVGLLGLSGITAYFGVMEVCRPRPGDRVVVSGAYGGVGQVAVQIAKLFGASVLGIVSSDEKQARLAANGIESVKYRDPDWTSKLSSWAPEGVDIYFDNVWGATSSRVVERMKPLGLIALCGQVSGYDDGRIPPLDIDWYLLLTRSLTLRGFRAIDYLSRYPEARTRLGEWFRHGSVSQDVEVVDGLDSAPAAFLRLLTSSTVGKATVAVS